VTVALDLAAIRASLDRGEALEAWSSASTMTGRDGWLARCEVLHRAGDPVGALTEARGGLEEFPGDLDLLFWATNASLWIGDAQPAVAYVDALEAALERASGTLSAGDSADWSATALRYRERATELREHQRALDLSVARARGISIGLLLVVLLVLAWSAVYGRSRRPVS